MSRITFILALVFTALSLNSQDLITVVPEGPEHLSDAESSIQIQQFKLLNGLTVYLNPDNEMSDVLGAVVVRGGANHDPKDAEGTAHYFEHMMFKGSTSLGTIDYKSEKVYLDSIREAYDLLALSKGDENFRNGILRNIDRMSQKASEYAIPNEFNKVLSSIGGTRINAYTTYENIVYHNHFPAESMEQWIALQVDRFQNPVFRLFQSELETVYEEKNMSMDNTFRNIFEELYKSLYPSSVYGKQTVLGSVESLKTPSISKMETYFKDYYAANNMALILVGNFDAEMIIQMLESSFGKWREGHINKFPPASETAFDGRVEVKKKMSPVPMGVLGFRTVAKGHPDELALEVINELLTNDASTGLLDELAVDNELMYVVAMADYHYDIGTNFIAFVPKPFIQSLKSGEKKIIAQLDKLKNGDFDDQLLKAIVVKKRKDFTLSLESSDNRSQLIIEAFMTNRSVNQVIAMKMQLDGIDKITIQRIAKKYYGNNYLAFLSKMGSPKQTRLEKPNITPIKPINNELNSIFAEKIMEMPIMETEPNFINFSKDIISTDIISNLHFYYTTNPMNDIYSVELKIGVGLYEKKNLEVVAEYLNLVGSKKRAFKDFRTAMQLTGTSIYCHVDKDFFHINMTGFDASLGNDLGVLKSLLTDTEENEDVLKKIVKEFYLDYKLIKKDIGQQSIILQNYAIYGENSYYLQKISDKEMKKLEVADIVSTINQLLKYETEIHFVGRVPEAEVKMMFHNIAIFSDNLQRSTSPIYRPLPTLSQNELYFMNNKKAIQSHIRLTIPSIPANAEDRIYVNAFNKYFGLGMSSIVFREIREYRSLAYSAYAYLNLPFNFSNPTHLYGAMTTQADKTNESMEVFLNLMNKMSIKGKSVDNLKKSLLHSFNSQMPNFRRKSQYVAYWQRQGYDKDPRIEQYYMMQELNIDDIFAFYNRFVLGRMYTASVVGDEKRIDMSKLKENTKFTEVKLKNIYRK